MNDKRRLRIPRSSSSGRVIGKDTLLSLDSKIKPDFKRAVGLGILALICLGVGDNLGGIRGNSHSRLLVASAFAIAFAILGASAVRSAGRETFRVSSARGGLATATGLRLLVSMIGYGLVLLGILQLLNVRLASLLVGGVVTGVVVGIAAQQTLGNFFAGLVLLFARPYVPGQRVIVHSGSMGGPFEGEIVDAGLLYSTIVTDDGPVNLPNSGLLAAAVGPAPARPQASEEQSRPEPAEEPAANLPDPSTGVPEPSTNLPI